MSAHDSLGQRHGLKANQFSSERAEERCPDCRAYITAGDTQEYGHHADCPTRDTSDDAPAPGPGASGWVSLDESRAIQSRIVEGASFGEAAEEFDRDWRTIALHARGETRYGLLETDMENDQ